ncbi:MAG: LamG domain-containing protein [Chitinispirillaceae bacterium]|nr:LamG domain-containing protein [Chitinispirillaceae bacterium]
MNTCFRLSVIIMILTLRIFSEPAPVAHWTFDEGRGDSLHDDSGNKHNGKVYFSSWAPGKTGNSLYFSGKGSDVYVFYSFNLPEFTIAAWVKPESVADGRHIIYSELHGSRSLGMSFGFVDGKLDLSFYTNGSEELSTVDAAVSVAGGGWHFVAATYDSIDAALYFDGEEIARKTFNASIAYIEIRTHIGTEGYRGNLDEMSLYNSALGPTEITSMYEALNKYSIVEIGNGPAARPVFSWTKMEPPYHLVISKTLIFNELILKTSIADTMYQPSFDLPVGNIYWKAGYGSPDTTWIGSSCFVRTGLLAHWTFNEGTGDTVHDAGGNGYNGRVINGAWDVGKKGNALLFNGEGTNIRFDNPDVVKLQEFTIAAWIKAAGGIGGIGLRPLFSNTRNGSDYHEGMNFGFSDGKLRFSAAQTNGGWFTVTADDSVVDDAWHFIAAACDDRNITLYHDGKKVAENAFTWMIEYGVNPPSVGAFLNCSVNGYFAGNIDEFTLYNAGLAASEIAAIHDSVSRYHVYEIHDGVDTRPLFSWTPTSPPYCLYAAKDLAGTDILFQIATSDTAYRPSAALAAGPVYWKVGCGFPDTAWIGSSRFIVKGPAAYWNFDEGTGDMLHDMSGNGCGGNISNAVWGIGKKGNALLFNDTGTYVVVDKPERFALQRFTIVAWIKPDGALKGEQLIFSNLCKKNNGSEGMSFGLTDGKPRFTFARNGGRDLIAVGADTAVTGSEAWHFIALTCSGDELAFFIDGNEVTRKPFYSAVHYGVNPPRIGRELEGVSSRASNFTGVIDELSVYHGALDPSEIKAVYDAVSLFYLHTISDGKNRRPWFSWEKATPPYCLLVAKDFFFEDEVLKISIADTAYRPSLDLPTGVLYWKVGYGAPDTSWIGSSSFEIYPGDAVVVPEEYPTITEAVQHGSTILVRSDINENMVITDADVTITGAYTGITVTGKARITNSRVVFNSVNLAGINGTSFSATSAISPNPCPTPKDGTDGDTALIAVNSTIIFRDGFIRGGSGGAGQTVQLCGGPGAICTMCDFGKNGNNAIAILASDHTVIDADRAAIGTVSSDSTCTLAITAISSAPAAPAGNGESPAPPRLLPSGKIVFSRATEFTAIVYDLSGRMLAKETCRDALWRIPASNRGVYLITIKTAGRVFRYSFVKVQ